MQQIRMSRQKRCSPGGLGMWTLEFRSPGGTLLESTGQCPEGPEALHQTIAAMGYYGTCLLVFFHLRFKLIETMALFQPMRIAQPAQGEHLRFDHRALFMVASASPCLASLF